MRLVPALLSITLLAACEDVSTVSPAPWASQDGETTDGPFAFQGSLWEARGMAIEEDGSAQVGMGGNTCDVDPETGNFENDVDVANGEDEVVDGYGGQVLVLGDGGLSRLIPGDNYNNTVRPGPSGDDILTARFVDGGIVVVRDTASGCFAQWTGDVQATVRLPGCGDVDVERSSGTLFVATPDGSAAVTPGGVTPLPAAQKVAWLPAEQAVVLVRGGADVGAFSRDGEVLWTAQADAPIFDVVALGDGARFAFNTADALHVADAGTGAVLGLSQVRDGRGSLVAAADGGRVAVVRQGARVYDIVE